MGLFRQSLSEDSVDPYNHTWSVALLLALAFTSWLIPYSPVISSLSSSSDGQGSPRYRASCWTPVEFTTSYVSYANQFCAAAFNRAIKTGESSSTLYYLDDEIPFENWNLESLRFNPVGMAAAKQQKEDTRVDTYFFVAVTVPLALFVLAIVLKLPHILWTLMSSCSSLNVDKALDTACQSSALDADSRRQLNSDIGRAVRVAASSSRGLAASYLFFKLLTCVVVVCELAVLSSILMPELNRIRDRNDNLQDSSVVAVQKSGNFTPGDENTVILVCEFGIRQLQNMQTWNVQCLFSHEPDALSGHTGAGAESPKMSGVTPVADVLSGYQALLTAVLAYLVLLLVVDGLSLVTWTSRLLLGTCTDSLVKASPLSMDLAFVMRMSRENAGPLVTQVLGRHLIAGSISEDEAN